MKKLSILFGCLWLLVGCQGQTVIQHDIKVYSRDSSSGTRIAFEAILDMQPGSLTPHSAETTSNADMATQVGRDTGGIGYVSLATDFSANHLRPLEFAGVVASNETVINGSYRLARPFEYVTRRHDDFGSKRKEQLVVAFLDFLVNSKEGRQFVVHAGGIVDVKTGTPWSELKLKHPIVNEDNSDIIIRTAGSTSVERTLKATIEAFMPLAGNFRYQPNQTGSSDGYKRVLGDEKDSANAADIGFASRTFNPVTENTAAALLHGEYAKEAVVVVVNADNHWVKSLDAVELRAIFTGQITDWDAFGHN